MHLLLSRMKRGRGLIYLPPLSENRLGFCSLPVTKTQPVFLPGEAGCIKHRPPLPPAAAPAGITHYTLQARSCAKGEEDSPLETPGFVGVWPKTAFLRPRPHPSETQRSGADQPTPRADLRRFFVRPVGRDGRKNAWEKLCFRVAIFDKLGYNKLNPNRRLQHEKSG